MGLFITVTCGIVQEVDGLILTCLLFVSRCLLVQDCTLSKKTRSMKTGRHFFSSQDLFEDNNCLQGFVKTFFKSTFLN